MTCADKSSKELFIIMYKRRFSNRTPRGGATPRVTTSTPKTSVEAENESGRSNFAMSGISLSQKRKETETQSQRVLENTKKAKIASYSTYFEEVVCKAGYIFKNEEIPHVLSMY